jgi:hypothetical protein
VGAAQAVAPDAAAIILTRSQSWLGPGCTRFPRALPPPGPPVVCSTHTHVMAAGFSMQVWPKSARVPEHYREGAGRWSVVFVTAFAGRTNSTAKVGRPPRFTHNSHAFAVTTKESEEATGYATRAARAGWEVLYVDEGRAFLDRPLATRLNMLMKEVRRVLREDAPDAAHSGCVHHGACSARCANGLLLCQCVSLGVSAYFRPLSGCCDTREPTCTPGPRCG